MRKGIKHSPDLKEAPTWWQRQMRAQRILSKHRELEESMEMKAQCGIRKGSQSKLKCCGLAVYPVVAIPSGWRYCFHLGRHFPCIHEIELQPLAPECCPGNHLDCKSGRTWSPWNSCTIRLISALFLLCERQASQHTDQTGESRFTPFVSSWSWWSRVDLISLKWNLNYLS